MLAIVSFPSAPLTERLVRNALQKLDPETPIFNTLPTEDVPVLQYCTYDNINHELTHSRPNSVLASSYTIRKALIRKHFLHRCTSAYILKQPSSVLARAVPATWDIDIAWADELDDLFADELWDLAEQLDESSGKWFILKAGMADRGNGIRLFDSRDALREIFEMFDEQSSDGSADEEGQEIVTSQLRHFVIQEYLPRPLLLDPSEKRPGGPQGLELKLYKFHLRAYCVASGSLTVYLWSHILALFSGAPYMDPSYDEDGHVDLQPHLTNTSFHLENGEAGVRLLSELVGNSILSSNGRRQLTESDILEIIEQMTRILEDTFRAALASPVHFQCLPNAFELFGVDFMITHTVGDPPGRSPFQVHLLEVNSEPAIELTGPRLRWILESLHESIAEICVAPFFKIKEINLDGWKIGETRYGFIKCCKEHVRGVGGER